MSAAENEGVNACFLEFGKISSDDKPYNLLKTDGVHKTPEFYVSDTPDGFKSVAGLFLRNMEHTVTQIDIEQY